MFGSLLSPLLPVNDSLFLPVGPRLIASHPRIALVVLSYAYVISAFVGWGYSRFRRGEREKWGTGRTGEGEKGITGRTGEGENREK